MKQKSINKAEIRRLIKDSDRQYKQARERGHTPARFSAQYETRSEYLRSKLKSGVFKPNSSTGRRILRDIKEGHATFTLKTSRGHGQATKPMRTFNENGLIPGGTAFKNEREASKYSQYMNAIQKFQKGDLNALKLFEDKTYTDAAGNNHRFITDEEKLFRLWRIGELPHGESLYLPAA